MPGDRKPEEEKKPNSLTDLFRQHVNEVNRLTDEELERLEEEFERSLLFKPYKAVGGEGEEPRGGPLEGPK